MQTNNRLGCLTGTGILAAVVTIISIMVVAFFSGNQMFSAGALNNQAGESTGGVTSHSQIADCNACHTAPWESAKMADRCMDCHQDVGAQLNSASQLHGAIMQKSPGLSCRECHHEHRGAFASLTDMDEALFPHETLGFSLIKHQTKATGVAMTCSDCHNEDISTFASNPCQTCHSDMDIAFAQAHSLSYGTDCLACHDGVDRYGEGFNHNQLAFQLIGEHTEANCTGCHLDARSISDLQSTPQDCASCHLKEDAHLGAFGAECGVCHSPEGWTPAKFDHNLAAFKLDGKHTEVACEKCHVNNVFKGTPSDCYSCHQQNDEHNGQFGTECSSCHSTASWDDASFDHGRSNFPLTGAHISVSCEGCHANDRFAGTPTDCAACHAEPVSHAGQFGMECAACHNTDAWSPAQFNGEHTFPLNHGEQGTVACATCHPVSYTVYTCYGCHEHNESNVRSEHLEEGISDFQNCTECHADGREHEGGDD